MKKRSARSLAAEAGFRARVAELGGEVLEAEWLGSLVSHRVRCIAGHDCSPRPNSVQQGGGLCRTCAGNDPDVAHEAFLARVAELGGTVLEPIWLGKDAPHRVRCAAGHDCSPRPTHVRRGTGLCRTCAGRDSEAAWKNFRMRVEELGGTVLEQNWLGANTPHKVRCIKGHNCSPRPTSLTSGQRACWACAGSDPKAAWINFQARVERLGGEVLEQEWLGSSTPHRVRCASGHEVTAIPNGVRSGEGICRKCAGSHWDVFYLVHNATTATLKFGVTSGSPRSRLADHASEGFTEVVRLHTGLLDGDAKRLEDELLHQLRVARVTPVRGREYFMSATMGAVLYIIDGWFIQRP